MGMGCLWGVRVRGCYGDWGLSMNSCVLFNSGGLGGVYVGGINLIPIISNGAETI